MENFTIGSVVKLKSGGPNMTIKELDLEENYAFCVWYVDSELREGDFDTRTLELYVPRQKPNFGSSLG